MSSRVNPVASEIIRILFSLSRNGSESVDLQVLRKALDNHPNPQVSHVSPADFQGYINFLAGEKYRILQKRLVPGKERQQLYHLNVPDLTHFLRDSLIASVVKSKFGPHAHRLFQLLISKKMLENSQLYHLSMLRLGETRLLLHSMMLQNYVQTQQIPKTAERNAQRSIWCWTVDFPTVLGVVTRECTFALRNFRMRLSNERDKAKPLVDKLMSGINLEPKLEQPQFEQYNVVKARMQSTIAGLIHDIIVLKML
ncbi:DNA-directed RNA polymerase III subunit RPC3 [Pelomyxa schiedti]|nr:DNA-directed RNA polymerase III subunit RPC3 [Pelomyxa schiedti]